jgi:NADH:ubiquinone oxidoreductase subunit
MKALIITLLLIFNINFLQAQEDAIIPLKELGDFDEEIDKHYYYKDIDGDLNKFLGTWKFQDATREFIVTFYLKVHDESGGTYYDEIYARYKYTDNDIVIYDTLNDTSSLNQTDIFGASIISDDRTEMRLSYNEPTDITYDKRHNHANLEIKFIPCGSLCLDHQLEWKIVWEKELDTDPWPFKIPNDITLTKQ